MMKLLQFFYVMFGFAVARWVFHREAVTDPVPRLRSMGLL